MRVLNVFLLLLMAAWLVSNCGYQSLRDCFDGCDTSSNPDATGVDTVTPAVDTGSNKGEQGNPGNPGQDGSNGSSCSVYSTVEGVMVICTDGTRAIVPSGSPGSSGTTGSSEIPGTSGSPGPQGLGCTTYYIWGEQDCGVVIECGDGSRTEIPGKKYHSRECRAGGDE